MRLNEIIQEQQNNTNLFENRVQSISVDFWQDITDITLLPLSESAYQKSLIEIKTNLYREAIKLTNEERDYLFERLLNEGWVKDAAKAAVKGLNVIDKGKKVVIDRIKSTAKKIYTNVIPEGARTQIEALGKSAIESVKNGIQNLAGYANKVFDLISKMLKKYKKMDPCLEKSLQQNSLESDDLNILLETRLNRYFVDSKEMYLKTFEKSLNIMDSSLPQRLAKTVTLLKSKGEVVKGGDIRSIAYDLTKNNLGGIASSEAPKLVIKGQKENPYFPMSSYFKNNGIGSLIQKYSLELGIPPSSNELPSEKKTGCDIDLDGRKSLVEKFLGKDTPAGMALTKLGLQDIVQGIAEELKNHPGSFLISLVSAILTVVSGAGAMRIALVVLGGVLPAIGNAYVKHLENSGATEESIEFAKTLVGAIRGLTTILQFINIVSLAEKGWELFAQDKVPEPPQIINPLTPTVIANTHALSDLSPKAQRILTDWTAPDGNLELSPKAVTSFFNKSSVNMTPEQFEQFNKLVVAAKSSSEKYQELTQILNNPEDNGVIDIVDKLSNTHIGAANVSELEQVTPTLDLSKMTTINQNDFIHKIQMSSQEFKRLKTDEMMEYAQNELGVNSINTIRGIPLTSEEYQEFLKHVPDYNQHPFSEEARKYLNQPEFKERVNDIAKNTIRRAAEEKNIKLPDDFKLLSDQALQHTQNMLQLSQRFSPELLSKYSETDIIELNTMINIKQATIEDVMKYTQQMQSAGITKKEDLFNAVKNIILKNTDVVNPLDEF